MPHKRRILILAPHTDDAELGAGGSISRWVEEGNEVFSVAFSIARESVPPGFASDVLSTEVRKAAATLGIPSSNLRVLDYPVRRFPEFRQQILEELVKLRKEIQPTLILCPARSDVHQDHATITQEAVRAFKSFSLLGYELPWNTLTFSSEHILGLEKRHVEKKVAALSAYASQGHRDYLQSDFIFGWARFRGVTVGLPYAEAFESIRTVIR